MENQAHPEHAAPTADAELNDFGKIVFKFAQYGQNATNNLSDAFSNMTLHSWLRLVMIVGGYILFRSRFTAYMTKRTVENMTEQDKQEQEQKAKLSPNDLREGRTAAQKMNDVEEEEGDGTGADWGLRARNRQKRVLKQLWDAEEKRRAAEAQHDIDDEDIADLLED